MVSDVAQQGEQGAHQPLCRRFESGRRNSSLRTWFSLVMILLYSGDIGSNPVVRRGTFAAVVKSADTQDLGSCAVRCAGSSPAGSTLIIEKGCDKMDFLYQNGDHVVLLDFFEKSARWRPEMNAFIGKEGIVICLVATTDCPVYRVDFYEKDNFIDYWYVEENWMEPAKWLEIDTSEIDSFLSEFGGDHNV